MDASHWTLFASAFLSATLLPGNSELVLIYVLRDGAALWPAVLLATLGNTLGGITTFAVGHVFPSLKKIDAKTIERVRRWGAPILLLSWVPIIGDALCVAAGWLRLPWLPSLAALALGKFARYVAIALVVAPA
jgi:membrane protein YqaA with SNARE-associated domain